MFGLGGLGLDRIWVARRWVRLVEGVLWVNWDGVWAGLASVPTHDGETVMNGAPGFVGDEGEPGFVGDEGEPGSVGSKTHS
jgi:hypothetical protein